jgi:hypothetical protein
MKKKFFFLLMAFVGILVGLHFFRNPSRFLASIDQKSSKLEHVQIKTEMINAIHWTEESDQILFHLVSQDSDFCQKWTDLRIFLVADGMGVSGDSPGANVAIKCLNGGFEFAWPKQIKQWDADIQKTGEYFEIPKSFYVQSIEISGAFGKMKISNYEISLVQNRLFELKPQEAL